MKSLGASEAQIAAVHSPDEAAAKIATIDIQNKALQQAQAAAEKKAELAIRDIEAQRKVADQQEATELRSVERQEKLGQITVAAAAAAEEQILANHKATTDALLADEERWAAVSEKLQHEVAARKLEADQQYQDKKRDIDEKAADEEVKRAHATDQSIASELAGAITGGKESLGQAVQKIFADQEKKLLEKGITQLLDASGLGKALNSGEDLLLGFLPGAPKTTAGPDRLAASAGTAAGQVARLGDAAAAAAGKLAPGQTAPASSAPAAPADNNVVNGETASPAAPSQYAAAISAAAAQWNVPPAILTNLLGAESGFNPNAVGPPVAARGGERAKGLGQFMPEEAQRYGVDVFNPESSISGTAHYASDLRREKGSWAGALGAYSGQGPGLAGYAAEKNPYGPALVAAAKTADRPPAVAAGAPSAVPAPEAAASGNTQPALGAAGGEAASSGVPVDVQAVAGSTVSVADGLPIAAPETGGGILAALGIVSPAEAAAPGPPAPGAGASSPGFFGGIANDISDFIARPWQHAKEQLSGYLPPPSGVTAQGVSITGEPALALPETTERAAPVLGGNPFNAAGVAGAPGTPAGPALPAAPPLGPDLGNGFPAVADASDHLATSNDSLKGSVDKLTAATDKAADAKTAPAASSTSGGDQGGLGSLLGLIALGAGAAALFGRRTTGSAAASSPGTVFSSGGITTQTSGSLHPALVQTNPQPSAALGIAGAAIAGIGVLGALAKLFGGNKTPEQASSDAATQSGTKATQATSSLTGLASAIGNLDPAAKTATSAFSSLVSGLSSLLGGLGGGGGGGGAGGGGGIGGIFSLLLTPLKLLGGLFLERGGVVPSAEGGLVLGHIPSAAGGLSVADGKGGTLAIVHPNETILPSPISQLVQDLAAENRMGKIVAAQPQLGHFGLPPSRTGFAPPAAPSGPGRGDFAAAGGGDTHNHYEGDTHHVSVTAFDGHDVERLFMRNGSALAKSLARQKRITNSSWSH